MEHSITMYINAYSTVRDEIPGPFAHNRGAGDPEMAEHLQGFTGFVWERGGQEMTSHMFGLIRHIGETQRQYVFERDSIDGLGDWARDANAVFLLPDGRVVNAAGEDIIAGGQVPYHPAAAERAQRVRAGITKDTGASVPAHYPPVRSEFEAAVRAPREVAQRFMALVAVSELASHLLGGQHPPLEGLRAVLPDAFSAWTPQEARFVELLESGDVDVEAGFLDEGGVAKHNAATQEAAELAFQLQWSAAAAVLLSHVLQLQRIPDDEILVHPGPTVQWVAENGQDAVYAHAGELIALPELCDKYEFVRSLRWITVDDRLHPERPATLDEPTAGALLEWHRALSWLFTPGTGWDEVDLST
ncbi:DUF4272 domain-containing protein [Corynebacterium sp. NPDC060344]|uniref:DUF4272 domain-containing protein n=1 Tax=Corynebacterium sp. NPDC060344 TaxID=3347101 RepID=UPI0036633050